MVRSPQLGNSRPENGRQRRAAFLLFCGFADRVDRDRRIHEAVRLHHYKLREVAEYLGLHFSTISVIAKQQDALIRE